MNIACGGILSSYILTLINTSISVVISIIQVNGGADYGNRISACDDFIGSLFQ